MDGLGRINLLVGPNNCGKSTVLEAIDLLADYPDPVTVGLHCFSRGGMSLGESTNNQNNVRLVLRHMFYGRRANPGSEFTLVANRTTGSSKLQVSIKNLPDPGSKPLGKASAVAGQLSLLYEKKTDTDTITHTIPLNSQAEWGISDFNKRQDEVSGNINLNFVLPGPRDCGTIIRQLMAISLNPEEKFVLDVLRALEPRIMGITAIPDGSNLELVENRNGVFIKLEGELERIPIASLGDGIWRLLGLALALVHARGSVLMVDEIDIGLHYTAQVDMWRMVKGAAEKLDVQVFATTHSSDCIRALASLARPDVTTGSDITIQRIEGERAVAYNEREIVLAAERGIEVR
jgi:ABC-type branched-subunit amino acid transport system ATPase component